jgi:superoxide dismutase, Fe-Mn family
MTFTLPPLPYPVDALEPYISARTLKVHHGGHHKTYVEKLNKLVAGTPLAEARLEDIVRDTAGSPEKKAVFNNAAQHWNHTFFWTCMKPGGGGEPKGDLAEAIRRKWGTFAAFNEDFARAATELFGSGYTWLVVDGGELQIVPAPDADTPLAVGQKPLLTLDVWEHAYYLDYQNKRADFVAAFLDNLVAWDTAARHFASR